MSRAHADAVNTLLDAVANLTNYDETAPKDAAAPYVVARYDDGVRTRTSILPSSTAITVTFQVTGVGRDRNQAQAALERATSALVDVRPTVAGRSCSPIEQVASQPTLRDDDFTPPLFYAVNQFQFFSVPA